MRNLEWLCLIPYTNCTCSSCQPCLRVAALNPDKYRPHSRIILKYIRLKYDPAVYSVCKCIWNDKNKFLAHWKCMLFFPSSSRNNSVNGRPSATHTSVTINWTSLRQLHLIRRSCLCKACVQRWRDRERESVQAWKIMCDVKTGKKSGRRRHTHDTYEVFTLRTNSTTWDDTVTSANVRGWKMQPLPPVDMQLRHHHERSTAQTDLSIR